MIPDFFHVLTGWRKFDALVNGDAILKSVAAAQMWPSAELGAAFCVGTYEHDSHLAPALNCSCGYYAYKTRDDAAKHSQGKLLVRVELWGRIAEHERGYRAQHMKIVEIFLPPDFPARSALEARYRCPVVIDEGVTKWILESPFESLSLSPWSNQGMSYLSPPLFQPLTMTYSTTPNVNPSPPGPMLAPAQTLGASRWQRRQRTSGPTRNGFRD